MFEDNVIVSQISNILERYFEKTHQRVDTMVVSLDFEVMLERQMTAMLSKPLGVLIK